MNAVACDSSLSVSACGRLLSGGTFYVISMSSVFLSMRSVCAGLLRVDSGMNTGHKSGPTRTGSHTPLSLLVEKKTCVALSLWQYSSAYCIYTATEFAHFCAGSTKRFYFFIYLSFRYQRPGSKATEESLQSDLHSYREDFETRPQTVEEKKRDGPLRFRHRDKTGKRS